MPTSKETESSKSNEGIRTRAEAGSTGFEPPGVRYRDSGLASGSIVSPVMLPRHKNTTLRDLSGSPTHANVGDQLDCPMRRRDNYDCDIHYLTPELRIIPFCSFNVIREWYRDKIQQKYGLPIEAWEAKNGKKLEDGPYRGKLRRAPATRPAACAVGEQGEEVHIHHRFDPGLSKQQEDQA